MKDQRNINTPPKFALTFLRWFCATELLEDVEGDLTELYRTRAERNSVSAKLLFVADVFLLFRPGIIKNFSIPHPLMNFLMLKHHVKTTLRQVRKFKGYTAINLSGLVVGLASCLLIILWVLDEVNMNRFHEKSDRIYQVWRNMYQRNGDVITTPFTPQPMEITLREEYPELEHVTTISWEMEVLFRREDKSTFEKGLYVGPGFFDVFTFPVIAGDKNTLLNDIHSVVISERMARNYFGEKWNEAVGQSFKVDETRDFVVTGIFKDPGTNSTIRFDWVIPSAEYYNRNKWAESWYNGTCHLFFTLKPGADIAAVGKRAEQEINNHTNHEADERVSFQLFADNYLHGKFENGIPVGGRIQYVRILTAIAIFMLVVACINFMNLATARSSTRAKEIGVRKVMGAKRGSLSGQFFTESFLYVTVSMFVALILVFALLPYFNTLTGKAMVLNLTDVRIALGIVSVVLVTGLLSGSYPALSMSAVGVINALKGKAMHGTGGSQLRQGLATLQFAISIFLICGSIVVSSQMDYILTQDIGLDKENAVLISLDGSLTTQREAYLNELQRIPEVKSATLASSNPSQNLSSTGGASWEGKNPEDVIEINVISVGPRFLETMGIGLAEGKNFSGNLATDTSYFIVNEVLAGIIGDGSPVGKQMSCWRRSGTIIGVVKNFHMASMYEQIAPLIIRYDPSDTWSALIKTQGSTQKAIEEIEKVTKKLNPAFPFRYEFMDETYAKSYQNERTVSTLLDYFAVVCIFISCLGLLGLSSFSADQRAKEIGIRKVLGAGVFNVVMLISRDYVRIMIIACLLAIPLSYYYLQNWLSSFVFRMDLSVHFFVIAGLLGILLGALTVGLKSFKAAMANPKDTLKEE
jgi:putative ABC transport system permease protein